MPTWLLPLVTTLWKNRRVCLVGLILLGVIGYNWSMSTFAMAETVERQGVRLDTGIALILVRLDVSDAEGKLREITADIRAKQAQLDDMTTVLDGMDLNAPPAAILRQNIRELSLDITDLRRQESNGNQALISAQQSLARASTAAQP